MQGTEVTYGFRLDFIREKAFDRESPRRIQQFNSDNLSVCRHVSMLFQATFFVQSAFFNARSAKSSSS